MFPAFKEWSAVVNALAAGAQTLILRKGGIAEPRGGFVATHDRFWLLPTHFHAQAEKLTAAAHPFLPASTVGPSESIELTAYAELIEHRWLDHWDRVAALAPWHCWQESTVRERFDWSRPKGIHLMLVRVHRLVDPMTFSLTATQAGCKSWVDLPVDFHAQPAVPALADADFTARSQRIHARL